jgi:hypothetical protein
VTPAQTAKRPTEDPAGTALDRLVARFDPSVFDTGRPLVRIRVEDAAGSPRDVVIEDGAARVEPARGTPDSTMSADAETWDEIAENLRGGMEAPPSPGVPVACTCVTWRPRPESFPRSRQVRAIP